MKTYLWFILFCAFAFSAKADLTLSERASVTDLPKDRSTSPASEVALGDQLTIVYRVSQPSADPFGDPDSVVYDHVQASIADAGGVLFSTSNAELTVWKLTGFSGIAVSDLQGPYLDFLASNDPTVTDDTFLRPGLPISAFDVAAGGSVFADGEAIGFQTIAYSLTGSLPSPVPEPAVYGMVSVAFLFGLMVWTAKRRGRSTVTILSPLSTKRILPGR